MKVAGTPAMVTWLAPTKALPEIVTVAPAAPDSGLKPVMRGCTVNDPACCVTPPSAVTVTGPSVAPLGTVACSWVGETTVNAAAVRLNATRLIKLRPVPVTVTVSPTPPVDGERPLITGAATALSCAVLVATPSVAVTV